MNPMDYLSDDDILIVSKPLAKAVGIGPAIVLRRLHFWLTFNQKSASKKRGENEHFRDNCWWAWNTYQEWAEDVEIYSEHTIQRCFTELEDIGLVVSNDTYNKKPFDRTKWYTIDYRVYEWFMQTWGECGKPIANGGRISAERQAFLDKWAERRTNPPMMPTWNDEEANLESSEDANLPPPIPVSPVSPSVPLTGRAATSEKPAAPRTGIFAVPASTLFGEDEEVEQETKKKKVTAHDDIREHELVELFSFHTGVKSLNKDMLNVLVNDHRLKTEDGLFIIQGGLIGLWDGTPGFANFCRQRIPEMLAMENIDIKPLALLQHLRNLNKPDGKIGFWLWRDEYPSLCKDVPATENEAAEPRSLDELQAESDLLDARFGEDN